MLSLTSPAWAKTAYWAGVSFSSFATNKTGQQERFPFASQIFRCAPVCPYGDIDELARARLAEKSYKNFNISLDLVGTRQPEGLIITPLIARESIIIAEDINADGTKEYEYALRFFINLMLFEFKQGEGRFSGSFPFVFKHVETSSTPLSDQYLMEIAASLYSSTKRGKNIFDELYKQAKDRLAIADFSAQYPRISTVSLSDEVRGVMDTFVNPESFAAQTAQIFESNLVRQTGGMLIPFLGEDDLELNAVFADGARTIKLPEQSADISLDINRFVYWEKINGAQKTVCFITLVTVTVQTTLERVMELDFKRQKDSCGVIRTVEKLSPHMQFPEQLYSVLWGVAQQFGNDPDPTFLNKATTNPSEALRQIKSVKTKLFQTTL